MELDRRRINLFFDVAVFLVIFLFLVLIRRNIINVISPFIFALVVAYLLDPLVRFIEKKGVKNRALSILLVFIIIIGLIIGLFMTVIPNITKDVSVLIADIPNIINSVEHFINNFREGNTVFQSVDFSNYIDIDNELANLSDGLISVLGAMSTKLIAGTGKLVDIIMVPIITFYYLKDKEDFVSLGSKIIPRKFKTKLKAILSDIDVVLGGFIRGQLLIALFVGILTGIACRIIGLPYSITIGMIAGLTNVIPYFGPWIGGIFPIILALITNPVLILWTLVAIIIIQQIESTFLSPQIMSHSVGLHPIAVIFSILLFGNIFGVIGMIIGVPIAGTIKVLIKYVIEFREEQSVD
ncbi:AI-2E family transporter [Alkalibaculum sp. M08DMB]|uniref:AI-2E family transporter n=1 Tax=Alkalibaculum sporogenes TaxID=2655001 RepID=A0A6A7KAI9_9FIRM|nr:AI-2E family transporter [Alkalibaculum sporogenes]MPW26301.1 AI-2E family transporter [Alkalibaculum sporogenes]